MTRNDYEAIAAALLNIRDDLSPACMPEDYAERAMLDRVTEALACVFMRDNARFDCVKFSKAAGFEGGM